MDGKIVKETLKEETMSIQNLPHKSAYVSAWKKICTNPDAMFQHPDWSRGIMSGKDLQEEFSKALQKRINERGGIIFKGRKYDPDWVRSMYQAKNMINIPRLIIDWLPKDLEKRFAHRLRKNMEI